MKRWLLIIVALALVLLSAAFIWLAWKKHERDKREASYQAALSSYANHVKPGMTRKEVEAYLHERNAAFRHMCCVAGPQNAWADLVRIGQESAPWYCSQSNVYVAFEFSAIDPKQPDHLEGLESDRLVQVTISRWLEGCP